MSLSFKDSSGTLKSISFLFLDTKTFKTWHRVIRQALCDIKLSKGKTNSTSIVLCSSNVLTLFYIMSTILLKALYPKKHANNIQINLIKTAIKSCSAFCSKKDSDLMSRCKNLISLKQNLKPM